MWSHLLVGVVAAPFMDMKRPTDTLFPTLCHGQVLGRHCYTFSCCHEIPSSSLQCLLLAALQSGSVLLLEETTRLQPRVLLALGQYLQSLGRCLEEAFTDKKEQSLSVPPSCVSTWKTSVSNIHVYTAPYFYCNFYE